MSSEKTKKPGFFSKLFGKKAPEIPDNKRPALVMDPGEPTVEYRPDFLDICFCGSGKYFKSCCGSMEEKRDPPYGVFIFENYLSPDLVKEIRDFLDKQSSEALTVIDSERSTPDNVVTKLDDQRVSERVDMGELYPSIRKIVQEAFVDLAKKCVNREMDWFEPPQILRYYPGGFYHGHADSENLDVESNTWHKVIDRDLSLLIYLNDDFEGGDLSFDKFHYTLRPKAGTAVLFPSDNRYLHTAQTVHEGVRLAIVSWGSVKGIKKIASQPPVDAIRVE